MLGQETGATFDFRTIRKKPFSVYLVVQPLMVKPLAPLILQQCSSWLHTVVVRWVSTSWTTVKML